MNVGRDKATCTSLACPACDTEPSSPFFSLQSVPVFCNRLYRTREEATGSPTGNISLSLCTGCGTIYNLEFDEKSAGYEHGYANPLHYSAYYREYSSASARSLVSRYGLKGKTVVEIGCGDGNFLQQIVEAGAAEGIGFEPAHTPSSADQAINSNVSIIPDRFQADMLPSGFHAVICRHVLEHVANPAELLYDLRQCIHNDTTVLYFEVPNGEWMLHTTGIWDVIYEHYTYWTPAALAGLFTQCGFEPASVTTTYGGQYLVIEATAAPGSPLVKPLPDLQKLQRLTGNFTTEGNRVLNQWHDFLNLNDAIKGKVYIWGAGSKGITFTNIVRDAGNKIACMIDSNPSKQELYVPGCGIQVISPESLDKNHVDLILIMNSLYEQEIREYLQNSGHCPDIRNVM